MVLKYTPERRVFLFLQGPASPLFAKIADRLEARGHLCLRINLNVGDQIFWRRKGGHNYRSHGGPAWSTYIAEFIDQHAVTDIVLLGEERPYHQLAIEVSRSRKLDVFVVDMGYLRPDWITLERGGIGSNSHFPACAGDIVEAAQTLAEPDMTPHYTESFAAEAGYDLLYNLPNVFLWFLFPHYRRHALFHPLAEYAGWLMRLTGTKKKKLAAANLINGLQSGAKSFFVFPLQLQTDFQLRAHSPYNDQREAIREILISFAKHAPEASQLIIKVHPLDNGLIDWQSYINELSNQLDIYSRVQFLDGGDLAALLRQAEGTVTINSTVGLHALRQGKPVKVLGEAIFNIDGLSDQASLDEFWRVPTAPEEFICTAFFRLLAAATQVRGNFSSKAGTDGGAEAIALKLHSRSVNLPAAFVDPPPRKKPKKISPQRY